MFQNEKKIKYSYLLFSKNISSTTKNNDNEESRNEYFKTVCFGTSPQT